MSSILEDEPSPYIRAAGFDQGARLPPSSLPPAALNSLELSSAPTTRGFLASLPQSPLPLLLLLIQTQLWWARSPSLGCPPQWIDPRPLASNTIHLPTAPGFLPARTSSVAPSLLPIWSLL